MRHLLSLTCCRFRCVPRHCFGFLALGLLIPLSACKTTPPAPAPAFQPAKLLEMDAAINQAIADKSIPGGVLWLERNGQAYHKAYGHRALVPAEEPMTPRRTGSRPSRLANVRTRRTARATSFSIAGWR